MVNRILATYANASLSNVTPVTILDDDGAGNVAAFPAANWTGAAHLRLRIAATAKAAWVKLFKGAVVGATAGTAGELLVPAESEVYLLLGQEWDGLSILADAAGCKVSVSIIDPW